MTAWLRYAGVSAVVVVVLAVGVVLVIPGARSPDVWLAAGLAFVVQLLAFAVLVAGKRRQAMGFLVGWGGGMALRGAALLGLIVWVAVTDRPDPESLLLSLVAFMIVLALVEPVFLKMTD